MNYIEVAGQIGIFILTLLVLVAGLIFIRYLLIWLPNWMYRQKLLYDIEKKRKNDKKQSY